jgi:hypothetical protein
MSWSSPFDDPIPVPKGKPLPTLKDAADYIAKLPEAEQHDPAWEAAVEALILGRRAWRPGDVRSHRHHAGAKQRPTGPGRHAAPQAREGVQHRPMKELV